MALPEPRYSGRPLPARPWLPGTSPRAARPREVSRACGPPLDPAHWQRCEAYLFGVDLYNAGFFWECHEAWESVWRGLPRGSREREIVRGLVQLAAAALKTRLGARGGARRLAARGALRLRGAGGRALGIDLAALAQAALAHAEGRRSEPPCIRLDPAPPARG